ncbi:MAG: kelch repeat-containing protein [Gemmatimonadaceae bacterium]
MDFRRLATALVVATAFLNACSSDSSSVIAPLAQPASGFQLSSISQGATVQSANHWTALANLPVPRAYTVTAAANGKLYTFGGSDTKLSFNHVTEYNPATNTWISRKPLYKKLTSQLGATTIGSLIYIPGGWDGISYQTTLLVYDPAANSWSSKASMPIPGSCGGSVLIGGMLYAAIGCDNFGFAGKLLRYDPVANSWTQLPNAPGTHSGGAVMTMNNKLYWDNGTIGTGIDVYDPATNSWSSGTTHLLPRILSQFSSINGVAFSAGGYTVGATTNTTEYLDEKGNRWAARSNMIQAVGAASSAVINGELYVVGGNAPGSLNTVATVQKYTPGDFWLTATSMASSRAYVAAANVTLNDAVVAVGGRLPSSTTPLATTEVYNPATDSWSGAAPIPTAVWGAAATAIGGKVYVIGGFTGDTATSATNKVWEYTASSNTWAQRANAPTPIGFASAAVLSGKIYVALGTDGTTFNLKKAYRYDPVADSWAIGVDSPNAHSQSVATAIGPYFVTVGGSGSSGKALNAFSISTNSWVTGPDAPTSLVGAAGGTIGTNVFVAHGSSGGTFTAATSVFDGLTKVWSTRMSAPEALAFAGGAATGGRLLTVGGIRQNGTATNATRLYVP